MMSGKYYTNKIEIFGRSKKKPEQIVPAFRVDEGARTLDPQNHNLML